MIVLPAVTPELIATAITSALLARKDFLWALRITSNEAAQTISNGNLTHISDIGIE